MAIPNLHKNVKLIAVQLAIKCEIKRDVIELTLTSDSITSDQSEINRIFDSCFNIMKSSNNKITKNAILSIIKNKKIAGITGEIFKYIKDVQCKNENQIKYLKDISMYDINFGVGPAGTGKTYLAIFSALVGLQTGKYNKIILTRPAVEADESLGYLPGSLEEKLDPYLRPLYDSIEDLIGKKELDNLLDSGRIEISPLAYMRGRTLSNAFIILDEAQNTTISQLKMFLTRIGLGSKMVITGDIRQSDLKSRENNGLKEYIHKLKPLFNSKIGFVEFDSKYIIRHPIISDMLKYI